MTPSWILVTGVTNPRDAHLAEALGADAVGVVLVEGDPRRVRLDLAAEITLGLTIEAIAIMADPSPEELRSAVLMMEPSRLQLRVPPAADTPPPLPWYLSFPARDRSVVSQVKGHPGDRFLLDLAPEMLPGGAIWQRDRSLLREVGGLGAMVLGGLPDLAMAAEVVERARPWGIVLGACVEQAPGLLDGDKLQRAMRALRGR
jgi:phosphoribosylanthranilate isomerase